jgi:DNA-binding transcriptional MerR regulator
LRIGELAKRTGVSVQTLRFYEAEGLLGPVRRTAARYRLYDEGSIERVEYIRRTQQAGATLADIRQAVEWRKRGTENCRSWMPVLLKRQKECEAKLAEIRTKLAALNRLLGVVQRCHGEQAGRPGELSRRWCPVICEFSQRKVRCRSGVIQWKG